MTCRDCIHRGLCYKENDYKNFADRCGDFVADLYESCRLRYTYEGSMHDEELEELLQAFCDLLHDVEWRKSGDTSDEDYRKTVAEFKRRWLK